MYCLTLDTFIASPLRRGYWLLDYTAFIDLFRQQDSSQSSHSTLPGVPSKNLLCRHSSSERLASVDVSRLRMPKQTFGLDSRGPLLRPQHTQQWLPRDVAVQMV